MRPRDSFAGRDGSRRKTRRHWVVASFVVAGCVGTDPSSPQTEPELSARDAWTQKAWPALATCNGCHGTQPAITWLSPGTVDGAYTTVFMFQPPVVSLDSPASSVILTMGKHTGPALQPDQAIAVLKWLETERDERITTPGEPIVVGPITASLDAMNDVDLGHGATMHIKADAFEGHLEFATITIQATTPVHITHPLFVSRPHGADPIVDDADRYDDIDADLGAGETLSLTAGAFLDFSATDPFTIHFKALEAR
jgi:hypothetical protein